ncbi:MAG: sigma-70 family RNA polymerase sigma factor [Candidatus Methylomirabilales bacterium]
MSDGSSVSELFVRYRPKLVHELMRRRGVSHADAEDAVQEAFLSIHKGGGLEACKNPLAYLRKSILNTHSSMGRRQSCQTKAEEAHQARHVIEHTTVDTYHLGEDHAAVQEWLSILTPSQREVATLAYLGCWPKKIVSTLGKRPETIRSHLSGGRKTLRPFRDDECDVQRWFRAGERTHEAYHRGEETVPGMLRPVVDWGWAQATKLGVHPQHWADVPILDSDEVARRRGECLAHVTRWVRDEMITLAEASGTMMAITDDDAVLWRGGRRKTLAAVSRLGFSDGALWGSLKYGGVNAISMCLLRHATVTINRWEHTFPHQHSLSCVAAPVIIEPGAERPRLLALNLTGTQVIPIAVVHQLESIATRLRRSVHSTTPSRTR